MSPFSTPPRTDPTFIFDLFRGNHATELLVAAAAGFDLFTQLARTPLTFEQVRAKLVLDERPARVLFTALRAMGLLQADQQGQLTPTPAAREHLVAGEPFFIGDYLGLAAQSEGVRDMLERLCSNRPAGDSPEGPGASFIYREGLDSAMESADSARFLTMALAGRARNVAPVLASVFPLNQTRVLLDVGGGTGIYSLALLQRHANLRAIVLDRPEVLKVARELAAGTGVEDRIEFVPADMFVDEYPPGADAALLSNILHDWDVPRCEQLLKRCADALPRGGRVLIHDVFLNDALDGPLPVALYSAALFSLTEGRAYSAAEYREMLRRAGLAPAPSITPTLVHCGLLEGIK